MARKQGSKRARYKKAVGGVNLPNLRFTPEQLANIQKNIESSKTVAPSTNVQSARDFAPNVPGAGTAYVPNQVGTAIQPSSKARGVLSAGTIGLSNYSDEDIANQLGIEFTGERDQDQMVQDQIQQVRQAAARAAGEGLTPEQIEQGFKNYQDTVERLKNDPAFREQWFGKRVHKSKIGQAIDKIGGPAGLFGLTVGALTGGLGYAGMLGSMGAGAAAGAGTAAITGEDPLKAGLAGAAGGVLGGAIGGAGGAGTATAGGTAGGTTATTGGTLAGIKAPVASSVMAPATSTAGLAPVSSAVPSVAGGVVAKGGAAMSPITAQPINATLAGLQASGLPGVSAAAAPTALTGAGAASSGLAGLAGTAGAGLTLGGIAKGAAALGAAGLAADAFLGDGEPQQQGVTTQPGTTTMAEAPDKKPPPVGLGDPTSEAYMGRPEAVAAPQIDPESLQMVETGPASTVYQMADTPDIQAQQAQAAQAQATTAGPAAQAAAPQQVQAAQMEAARAEGVAPMEAAQGQLSPEALAQVQEGTITQPAVAAQRDQAAEQAAMAEAATLTPSEGAMVGEVTGEVAQVSPVEEAMAQRREAITGVPAPRGEAVQIRLAPKTKASVSRVTADSDNIEGAVDNESLDAQQILTELPEEALVTTQLDNLLEGLDSGEIPTWARPAVDSVNQMLAQRGLSASTVGRDALFSAIIQSAMPLAQSNAQALQARAAQNLSISADFLARNAEFKQQMEMANLSNDQQMRLANLSALNAASADNLNAAQQTELANLQARMETNLLEGRIAAEMNVAQLNVNQQRAVQNANTVANMDMARFNAQQQVQLANSQFMQTMTIRDFDAQQQAIMQNATAMASMDIANLDARTRIAAQNAQSFLQMDMANLQNDQQARMLNQQQAQQTMLSNQAAENAARQFNAANQQQTDQFMASLASQTQQFNASQLNAMKQFNASEQNRIAAQNAQNATQVSLANAEMINAANQFNAQLDQQREQFNVANRQAIEQADVAWRRQANTINTAAINAANQQNVMNQFNMTMFEQQQLWQQLRDEADYIRQSYENEETRKTQLYATAIGNESSAANQSTSSTASLVDFATRIILGD